MSLYIVRMIRRLRSWERLICGFILLGLFLSIYCTYKVFRDGHNIRHEQIDVSDWPEIIIIKKKGGQVLKDKTVSDPVPNKSEDVCILPQLSKNDPELSKFFKTPPTLSCTGETWVLAEDGKFVIKPNAINKHGNIKCSYSNYYRVNDNRIQSEIKSDVVSGTKLEGDYFKSDCSASDGTRVKGVHSTIIPRDEVIERSRKTKKPDNWLGLNVYMFGFDSISRMTFERKMPITYDYIVNTLEAAVLHGYNIVGDGTPQAFIPILTGKTEQELPLTRRRFSNANYVDIYPMIWKEFKKAGYATLYGEDAAAVGTFTYRLKGFREQPTDHYYRTFYSLVEKEAAVKHHCIGDQPQHTTYLRYGYEFMTRYPSDVPKFGILFHSLLSHDDINLVQVADKDTYEHIKQLEDSGILNNTLLIVMADHGHRFAEFRDTQQGQLEERLPFFSFVAPKWFREQNKQAWSNLISNCKRLTSPFDIYSTLQALIWWKEPGPANTDYRSVSLWDAIPINRTCAQAGIEPHWCTCLQWKHLHKDDPTGSILARAVTEVINRETYGERKLCAKLKVGSVVSVSYQIPHESLLKYKNAKDIDGFVPDLSGKAHISYALYQIRFYTTPGNALYDATVTHDVRVSKSEKSKVLIDLDDVSHINKYGDAPHCIIDKDYFLVKWCVCYDRI